MSRATYIPITGTVLEWARKEAGFTAASLAAKVNVEPQQVRAWETEDAQPTKTQFRGLVAALRRPSALFFTAAPPAEAPLRASFRRASGETGSASPNEFGPLQTARRYQALAEWLTSEVTEVGEANAGQLSTSTVVDPGKMAYQVRGLLGISFARQTRSKSPSAALKEWRTATETRLGVYVFQMQFPREARKTRGFSLPSRTAPVVVLNSAFTEQARIFTLFHECAHLFLEDAVVCDIWRTNETVSKHERWAESFAAHLLLPGSDFSDLLRQTVRLSNEVTTSHVRSMATRTRVSVRAVALRCIEYGFADWSLYDRVVDETREVDYKPDKEGGGGGETTPYRRFRELGFRFPGLVFHARNEDVIGHYDVLKYLDMNTAQAQELESLTRESQL